MKKILLSAALLGILAGSCTNESIEGLVQDPQLVSIKASYGVASRTAVDGITTVWQEGDQIYVSSADGKCHGTLTLIEGASSANGVFQGFVSGNPSDLAYSVFPVPTNGVIDLTKRSADSPDAPMIATIENQDELSFNLTCGMVAIKINGAEGQEVTLSNETMSLGGTATVVYNSESKKYELVYTRNDEGVTVTEIPSDEAMVYVPVITSSVDNQELPTAGNINITVQIGDAETTINVPVQEGMISLEQVPEITYDETNDTIDKNGTVTPEDEETAQEALQKLLDDDTTPVITLSGDVELTSPLTVTKPKVIDLAGHTISNGATFDAAEQALVVVKRGGSLTINDSGNNGQIVVENNENIYNAIKMTTKNETSNDLASLVVNGGKIKGTYYGISGNGGRHNTSVTINGGTIGCSGDGCGIFQPQDGSLIINGGEIYGKESAVEIRAGKLTMTAGTLKCETDFSEPQKSDSGTTMRGGVALGVARHTQGKDVSVEIKGGTLAGKQYGVYEFSQENATGKAALTLKDPTYGINITSAALTCYDVSTQNNFAKAVHDGAVIQLSAGSYIIPTEAKDKILTISGTEETEISVTSGLTYAVGATITFNGITIQSEPEGEGYNNGFADFKYAYFNNCVINGTLGLDFSCEFNECVFNITGNYYNVWTWGAGTVSFTDCTFNSDGKALLVYANVLDNGTYHQTVNVNGCVFNDNGDNTVTGKAAIEITNTFTPIRTYDVFINKTIVNGFAQTVPGDNDFNATFGSVAGSNIGTNVWGNKMQLPNTQVNVVIDGVDVY